MGMKAMVFANKFGILGLKWEFVCKKVRNSNPQKKAYLVFCLKASGRDDLHIQCLFEQS